MIVERNLKTGLVSITFRKLTPSEIVKLVKKAGLAGVEWGGDVHVPHGDLEKAEEVRNITLDAGLEVCSYGSYYRAGESQQAGLAFRQVFETVVTLGAPTVRVWAGGKRSDEASQDYRKTVVEDLQRISTISGEANITVSCEYHGGGLTDTNESAQKLIKEVAHPNFKLYWQPPNGRSFDYCREGLEAILLDLSNIHAFHWEMIEGNIGRRPLAEGQDVWMEYLRLISANSNFRHWALLEYVKSDTPEQFVEDAATLRKWLNEF